VAPLYRCKGILLCGRGNVFGICRGERSNGQLNSIHQRSVQELMFFNAFLCFIDKNLNIVILTLPTYQFSYYFYYSRLEK